MLLMLPHKVRDNDGTNGEADLYHHTIRAHVPALELVQHVAPHSWGGFLRHG